MSFNLAVIVRESAVASPGRAALLFDGGRMTYADLDETVGRAAAGMRSAGVRRGDRVALMLPNVPQFVVAYFAVLRLGAVAVPMNVLLKSPEVAHQLRDSGARLMVVWAAVAREAADGVRAVDAGLPVYMAGGPADGDLPRFEDFAQQAPEPEIEPTDPQDTAVLIYTSGTTGRPKGAELTHIQLYMCADIGGRTFGVREDDVVCAALPLFHAFGLSCSLNTVMRFGATASLVPRFDPETVLKDIERNRITVFEGVPTMFFALLRYPGLADHDTGSVRVAVSGGAAIPGPVLEEFERRFGAVVLEGYGLTETAATACFNRSVRERRVLSVGKPLWGVQVRVMSDDGRELPPGEDNVGELVIRGYNVMKGYHGAPEATARVMRDGWFHTGDLGYADEDGFLFIVDRKKDLIIRGGYNVYPSEVEEVLHAHPAVAEAAVVGVRDERLGEEVAAVIVPRAGRSVHEAELVGWCRERMAAYKYPRRVSIAEGLPKNAIGKVLKRELVAWFGTPEQRG
jgi:long-chain acyl-CoA synthetase